MKRITFRAEERAIDLARRRAAAEGTTLSKEFARWLERYVAQGAEPSISEVLQDLQSRIDTGRKRFSRDEMNER